ncbi:transient receptor potential channel pyrexia-like [Amphibalanus amphitrite]|uniref:transient receptor potential channel pyrexia-like n=1 Tax=Amphibalanus amphitrite TaxID=1232801 RepID=UPI001C918BF9|nr:transient receptor potential channel pyrexia-like [Amphibalanus amphitrite]XP_043228093.1 transient receptor potential channel pyrexia-like [Amphibalanus amphitrite]
MDPDRRGSNPLVAELRPLLAGSPPPASGDSPAPLRAAHLLYEALVARDLERFSVLLTAHSGRPAVLDHCHGDGFTCLQYACEQRLADFVDALLSAGADPSVASPTTGRTALHWAAARDAASITARLLRGAPQTEVNAEDAAGATPLRLAVLSGGWSAVRELLRAGADVSVRSDSGRPLLHSIPAEILEEFLDSCVYSNGRYVTDRDCCIRLDYRLMFPRLPDGRTVFETAALFHLSTSREHRHLLRHPLVESFVDLKWWQVRPFFLADLVYYVLFLSLLTTLVVLRAEEGPMSTGSRLQGLRWATLAVTIPSMITKLVQLTAAPTRYSLSDRNGLLKIPLLLMTPVYLGADLERGQMLQLSAMMMLFAWLELFALLSRVPVFSIYARMLQTVLWRFVSFVFWYMALILGLTLSTYIMFKERSSTRRHPVVAFLRPFVMTMDKVDLKSLPIDNDASLQQLLFIALFFVMTVTLTNLVNGLAVTDIAVMRKHARIFSLVSRVHLLAYTESMMLDEPCEFLGQRRCGAAWCVSGRPRGRSCRPGSSQWPVPLCWVRGARSWLARAIRLRLRLPEGRLCLYPNRCGLEKALRRGRPPPTEPALPRCWRFSTELVAAARRLALQPTPRAAWRSASHGWRVA